MNKKKLKKKDYLLLFKEKKRLFSQNFIFFFKKHKDLVIKTAAKKTIGKACLRNYRKRRLKNILRSLKFKEKFLILGVIKKNEDISYWNEKKQISQIIREIIV